MAKSSIEEIKTIIRGLLVSSPEEVTVVKLRRDFKAQEGQDIPFYEFGFHDLTTFLRSIPDVCQISNNRSGPYAIVRLVESVKSAHVSSLVLRQRVTTKGRRRHSSVPSRGRPSRLSCTPAIDCYKQRPVPRPLFEFTPSGYFQPSEFQFSSYKETPNINNKQSEFSVYNSFNNSSNGYANNVESWLLGNQEANTQQENCTSAPDEVGNDFVDLEAIVDYHLREILISDEGLALKDVEEYLQDALTASETNHGNSKPLDFKQILRRLPYIRIVDNYVYHEQFLTTLCEKELKEESCTEPEPNPSDINGTIEGNNSIICEKGDLSANAIPFVPQGNNEKVQRLEQNLHSLMKDHVHGILASELKEKYKMKFAAPLNFQSLGCESTQDLAFNMPHIFSFITLENGDFKLFPSRHYTEQTLKCSKEDVAVPKKTFSVPEMTQRNVFWLMQGYPNGLNGKDFEQTYKDTFLEGIDIKQMGLSSIEEFLNFLAELNIITVKASASDTWLFPATNSVLQNLTAFENPLPTPEIIGSEVEIKNLKEQFPRDVVGPDLHVKQVDIPSWIKKGSLIEILVQEVNNPHNFWVTFCGEQYSRALDSLMDDLQAFYCSKSHSYRMPPEFIREGQDCVTQYVEEWHRARVTSIVNATEVEVYFYDYGTRRIVQKSNIHYLHTAHSALPAQAIRAVLANIAPVGDKWTQDASKKFLQLIANKALIGIVVSADRINRVFSLFLCDTSGDDDIYVHEVLISERFAVETGIDFNEKESGKIETNDLKTEKIPENENILMLSGEDERQPSESCGNLDGHSVLSTVLNNINQDESILHSDPVKEPQSSRKSSHSSFQYAMMNDNTNILPSNSTSVCFSGTSVSTASAPIVTKTLSNSSELRQQSAPPPGFSHISKCETESDISDKTESHTLNSIDRNNQSQQNEIEFETSKRHTNNDVESCEGRDSPKDTPYKKSDQHPTVKGVSSGVNADFSQVKAPYVNNYYSYSNWPSVPQAYSNFPFMPSSFSSVNALTPLSLGPYNVPPIPNPLEFCNMWYYDQCRQQAFLQGMLAHQQLAASTYPPLPPGLYIPPNYATVPPRNQMNISELHSPEHKINSKENSSASQGPCISFGTQTDVASSGESNKTILFHETSSAEVSSLEKQSEIDFASESKTHTNENDHCLLKTVSKTEMLRSMNTNCESSDTTSHSAFTVEVSSEEVVTKSIVDNSNCYSNLLTNYKKSQDIDRCTNETELNSQSSVPKNLKKKSLYEDHIDQAIADKQDSFNVPSSISKTEKYAGSNNLQKEFLKISDVQVLCENKFFVQEHDLKVQHHDEMRLSQNALKSQRDFNTKSGESGIVHHDGKNFHNLNHLKEGTISKTQSGLKILQIPGNDSVLESGCSESDEQEIAQIVFTDTPCQEEIDLPEDDYHEHEMIEKAQQEDIMKTCAGNSEDNFETRNILRKNKIANHNKLPLREWHDLIKEQKNDTSTNSELSCSIQSSVSTVCLFESSEKNKHSSVENDVDTNLSSRVDRFEVITDHLLEQEHLLTLQRASSCKNTDISSIIHDSHQEVPQKHSSLPEVLCTEFGTLSVTNEPKESSFTRQLVQQSKSCQEYLHVNVQESEFQNNLSKGEETTVDTLCKAQINPSKQVQPIVGAQLSSEVSASFISGPTQPAMSQKTLITLPTESTDQSKDNIPSDTLPSSQSVSWRTTWNIEEPTRSSLQRPLARDTSKNSLGSCTFRNPPKLNSPTWHKENPSGKRVTNYQFVKNIYLCSRKIHQINLDGRPYVLTDEIVSYFTPFNGRHVILKILEARKVEINFLELSRRRRPELFECLDKSDIQCFSRGPTGNVIGSIHFVPLRSVPYMLRALNKDDATLSMNVKEEMEKFDPSDPYWSGHCD